MIREFFDIIIGCCTGKRDRLEVNTPDYRDIFYRKPDNIAKLVIILSMDYGRDKNNAKTDIL